MNPTEQLMKLQQENGALLGRLNRVSKKGNELEEKNRELLQTNMVISFLFLRIFIKRL